MFNTDIQFYSIMIILSLILNIVIIKCIYDKKVFNKDEINGALIYENIGIIFGAKIFTYFVQMSKYKSVELIDVGLSSLGAVIGAIIMLIVFAIQFKKKTKDILFTFMIPIPLMYAIGKIGCFLSGCCYGIEYNGIGSVLYKYSIKAPSDIRLFPVQLCETICFAIIFIYVFKKKINNKFNYITLGIEFIMCGIVKFGLEYLRMSHKGIILSMNQIICLLFAFIGLIIISKKREVYK